MSKPGSQEESTRPKRPPGRGRGRAPSATSASSTSGYESPSISASTPESSFSDATATAATTAAAAISKLHIAPSIQPMQRPGIGVAGRKIEVETNFFPLRTLIKDLILYRYFVEIMQPSKSGGRGRGRILTAGKETPYDNEVARQTSYDVLKRCIRSNPDVFPLPTGQAYDRRKALYSIEKLRLSNGAFQWQDPSAPFCIVKITPSPETPIVKFENVIEAMKQAFEVSTSDRAIAQLLDIVTNQLPYEQFADAEDKSTVYGPMGRQFYKPMNPPKDLGCGRVAYDGYFKSVRLVMGEPGSESVLCLNVDAKKAPFFKPQPLLKTIQETLKLPEVPSAALSHDQVKRLAHHLKDVKVQAIHNEATYTITYISDRSALDHTFSMNGQETSVAAYMEQQYQRILLFPNLPCVISRLPNGDVYLPIELLTVLPNQKVDLKKSTPEQSSALIKLSGVPPVERRKEILQKVNQCGAGPNDPYCKEFGIERSVGMMKVIGRQLKPPGISVKTKQNAPKALTVNAGSWDPFKDKLFLPTKIEKWAAISCLKNAKSCAGALEHFLDGLVRACRDLGMQITSKPQDSRPLNDYGQIEPYFKMCAQNGVECVICFIEENDSIARNLIKFSGGVKYDMVTQCIRKDTALKKANPATFNNIVLKLNAKNGGVNNAVDENDPLVKDWVGTQNDVMYLGFDVNHPPPLSRKEIRQGIVPKEPSIVGAIANTKGGVAHYSMLYFLQDARQEEIDGLIMHEVIAKFVESFKSETKRTPTKAVVYRDGVSESQYKMVLEKETYALKNAFLRACGHNVSVTIVVCQKRHHTRFFPLNMRQGDKPSFQNIPAGTVVDTGPVSSSLFDFYLCSHTGLQGTSKATKYIVLRDENGFNVDGLQRLTYVLAHLYQRCAKSVSLPAPVYFAHHAATRGKELYNACARGGRDESSSGISSQHSESGIPELQDFTNIQEQIQRFTNRTFSNMTFL